MRKILLFVTLALCAVLSRAGEYDCLVFTSTAGTTTVMQLTGLTMTVSGSALQVTNTVDNVSFQLTDLASMRFDVSEVLMALDNVLEADRPVQVFTPAGVAVGSFCSLRTAVSSLDKGAYVITDGTHSQTVILP